MVEDRVGVLLVDQLEGVRKGLKSMIEGNRDLLVIGEAGSVQQGVAEALRLKPDVAVINLRLPDGSGVDACRQIRAQGPDCKVVILTAHVNEDAIYAAIMAGASGYILKDLDADKLRETLVVVAEGGSVLDPSMTTTLLERLRRGATWHPADDRFEALTAQEDRVTTLIGAGLTNREIAAQLSLTERTVRNYVSNVYSKLLVRNRASAARLETERRARREQV